MRRGKGCRKVAVAATSFAATSLTRQPARQLCGNHDLPSLCGNRGNLLSNRGYGYNKEELSTRSRSSAYSHARLDAEVAA